MLEDIALDSDQPPDQLPNQHSRPSDKRKIWPDESEQLSYEDTKNNLLSYLTKQRWKIDHGDPGNREILHATSPDNSVRLYVLRVKAVNR
jgi:hypothetical protein